MWAIVASAMYAALKKFLPSILAAFGIYFISDTVSDQIFDQITNKLNQQTGSLSADALNAVYFSGILEGSMVILTAYSTALAMKAAKSALSGMSGQGTP